VVQQLASDERVQVTDDGVLAFESEGLLKGAGGWEAVVKFKVEFDGVEYVELAEGRGTGDGVGVHGCWVVGASAQCPGPIHCLPPAAFSAASATSDNAIWIASMG